jgi:hypothetical protein
MSTSDDEKLGSPNNEPETRPVGAKPHADIKIIVKQPKVEKPVKEKKELTEGQKVALQKMNEARKKKLDEKKQIIKENEEHEKKERETAVKKAEEEAKKITDNVVVQKVRGRKEGTKVEKKPEPVRRVSGSLKEKTPPRQLTQREYTIMMLRQKGINCPDDASPYMIKMLLSRLR